PVTSRAGSCLKFIHVTCYALSYFWCFFFFSSRRRHTRWPRDWSSDVCSSDLSTSRRPRRSSRGPPPAPRGRREVLGPQELSLRVSRFARGDLAGHAPGDRDADRGGRGPARPASLR